MNERLPTIPCAIILLGAISSGLVLVYIFGQLLDGVLKAFS